MRFGDLDGVHKIKKSSILGGVGLSGAIFVVILIVFVWCVSLTSKSSIDEQKNSLYEAINKSVLQCYVTEGRYPESFEYIQEKYGITYDDSVFRVDYVIYGSNMLPEIDIIELGGR